MAWKTAQFIFNFRHILCRFSICIWVATAATRMFFELLELFAYTLPPTREYVPAQSQSG